MAETPRQTRHRLNKIEDYLRDNAEALGHYGVRLSMLLEVAHLEFHADYLAEEIRDVREILSTPTQEK